MQDLTSSLWSYPYCECLLMSIVAMIPLGNLSTMVALSTSPMALISGWKAVPWVYTEVGASPTTQHTMSISCTAQSWKIPREISRYAMLGRGESRLVVLIW